MAAKLYSIVQFLYPNVAIVEQKRVERLRVHQQFVGLA